ncbi:MAG TPA: glycoside hydrolase family 15 protein [Armatimonadota bacterium]|nr:glycoside hydrolase family 15 protein [Armatimonadota bacterium]
MPRDIPISNGSLLVNFNKRYQLCDFFWPHVGQENHTAGHPFHFGVWVDDKFSWVNDDAWQQELNYDRDTLVTFVHLTHPTLKLSLTCRDTVDFHENLYLREIVVHNEAERERQVRLFFSQDFHISGHAIGDTAYYEPERMAVFHYKGKRWFMINCARGNAHHWQLGVDQWAVGIKESMGKEGTWRDAEDGILSGNAAAQGSVDSCVALHLSLPAKGQATGWYWIAVGEDFPEVTRINRAVRQKGPATFLQRTNHYWHLWVQKERVNFTSLSQTLCHVYRRSLLILRTQIDNGGAILAANDYENAQYFSDTYSYMWPRDAAIATAALIDAGHSEAPRSFFNFCHQVITKEGYFLHKYNADGSLASSWHGWYYGGRKELPIQEDETALVLWALWRYFQRFHDVEFIKPLYRGLIIRAANWMLTYRDAATGLPLPSWDLWEERRGVFAWTIGAVWAGLRAAANFAEAFGEDDLCAIYRQAALDIRTGTERYLWNQQDCTYLCSLTEPPTGGLITTGRAESSFVGLWYFGMFPANDPRVMATMRSIRERLWVKTAVGGIARYEGDLYQRVSDDVIRVPGNPWFICTLWFAQWYIAISQNTGDLAMADELMHWAATRALPSGVMAEQVNPYTDEPVSVSPLTWSHATMVLAIHEYLAKLHNTPRYTDWQYLREEGCR